MKPEYASTVQIAQMLGVSESAWRQTAKRHGVPYVRYGRLTKYRVADVERWLETCRQRAEANQ